MITTKSSSFYEREEQSIIWDRPIIEHSMGSIILSQDEYDSLKSHFATLKTKTPKGIENFLGDIERIYPMCIQSKVWQCLIERNMVTTKIAIN